MTIQLVVALLLLVSAAPLVAQLEDANPATRAKCTEYLKTPLPAEALAIATPKAWPDCDSYKSYAGIGRKVDYAAARQCAWAERLAFQAGFEPETVAGVFGGPAMLAVLYANGQGVIRNIPLALRFVCEAGGAPAEIEGRVEHLESLSAKAAENGPDFDFCDDITSGFMEGFCAGYGSELEEQERTQALNVDTSHFTPAQRTSFDALLKLEEEYAHAHATGEINLSGSARAMYQTDAEDTLRDDFVAALELFETGRYPGGSADQYSAADARLNLAYRKAISDAGENKNVPGTVQPDGIRDAERAWLKYRDAWIAFAKLRYPSVSPDAWLILLTNDRTSILDGSFCDMDAMEKPCAWNGDTWKPSPLP